MPKIRKNKRQNETDITLRSDEKNIEDEIINVGIYARKSRFTEKGESITNQISSCKEEVERLYLNKEINYIIYDEDEGYSGKNTNRPGFVRMMNDARRKRLQAIVCYRLDRISRSVSDFSSLINEISSLGINFICIREKFDLTTPMGRAMMYISSVFAQLERETIAERIQDNMYNLAQTGRWLGGKTPLGFDSEKVDYIDERTGKQKIYFKLTPIVEQLEVVKLIFAKYLETGSISATVRYLIINGLETRDGKEFGVYGVRVILSNPVYAIADEDMYDFLIENECNLYGNKEEFNGTHGLIGYCKTNESGKTNRYNEFNKWIVAIGEHEGIIDGKQWVATQVQLDKMKALGFTSRERIVDGLLSGIIVCKECGSKMIARSTSNINSQGRRCYSYVCSKKTLTQRKCCNSPNIIGIKLDDMLVEEILNKKGEMAAIYQTISYKNMLIAEDKNANMLEISNLKSRLKKIEDGISSLIMNILGIKSQEALREIEKKIETLSKEKEDIKAKLHEKKINTYDFEEKEEDIQRIINLLSKFDKKLWDNLTPNQRRNVIKELVVHADWDGNTARIYFFEDRQVEEENKLPATPSSQRYSERNTNVCEKLEEMQIRGIPSGPNRSRQGG